MVFPWSKQTRKPTGSSSKIVQQVKPAVEVFLPIFVPVVEPVVEVSVSTISPESSSEDA